MNKKLITWIFTIILLGCSSHDEINGNNFDISLIKVALEKVKDLDALGYHSIKIIHPNIDVHVFPPQVIDDTLILRFEDFKSLSRYVTYAGWKNSIVLQPNLKFKRITINGKYLNENTELHSEIMKILNSAQQGVAPEPVMQQ